MSKPYELCPTWALRTWGFVAYDQIIWTGPRPRRENANSKLQPLITAHRKEERQLYTGRLTTSAAKKLKNAIQLLVAIALEKEVPLLKKKGTFKFKLNFITFTLPAPQGDLSDKDVKHLLDNWIKRARRKYNLGSYVWRAEVQANGNLHFHMITDAYIRWDHIRNDWNSILSTTTLLQKFHDKHGHWNPNSTDVHSIRKIKNLSAYFVKYMSKAHKDGERKIEGKLWDCSKNLKTKEKVTFEGELSRFREIWDSLPEDERVKKKSEHCAMIFIPESKFHHYLTNEEYERWKSYLARIRAAGYERDPHPVARAA